MRKLTDSDKQEILKLYRETAETTSTLAERYGVSNSTISRLLKSTLPEEEYEYLVSLKRAARTPEGRAQVNYEQLPLLKEPQLQPEPLSSDSRLLEVLEVERPPKPEQEEIPEIPEPVTPKPTIRRVKTRSSAIEKTPLLSESVSDETEDELEIIRRPQPQEISSIPSPIRHKPQEISSISSPLLEDDRPNTNVIAEMLGEDLLDEGDDLDDLDDEDFEDEDFEDEDFEEPRPLVARRRLGEAPVQVLPLSVAHLPKTCYLVIDRSAELITRPLRDFGDLGQIPTIETQQKTLPVFDNHRVAKRFSTKRDRVIKVPDSRMLHKARTHLQAKGITRLLIDGQVYSLSLM
ncbi:MAG TPA: transposase [Nostocaceae cyanobacterium]|nr:transposase [Nostocaceae cyanobacterium]